MATLWGLPRWSGILASWLAVLAVGCGPVREPPTARRPVSIRPVDHGDLLEEIARHRGRPVVLDCWSTSCPPCVREFPRLVALANRMGDEVVCMSLSFDYEGIGAVGDVLPKVRTFLESVGAERVVNLLGSEESDTLATKLGIISVPVVRVYGRDGEILRQFDDESSRREGKPFTYDDVEAAVREAAER